MSASFCLSFDGTFTLGVVMIAAGVEGVFSEMKKEVAVSQGRL